MSVEIFCEKFNTSNKKLSFKIITDSGITKVYRAAADNSELFIVKSRKTTHTGFREEDPNRAAVGYDRKNTGITDDHLL